MNSLLFRTCHLLSRARKRNFWSTVIPKHLSKKGSGSLFFVCDNVMKNWFLVTFFQMKCECKKKKRKQCDCFSRSMLSIEYHPNKRVDYTLATRNKSIKWSTSLKNPWEESLVFKTLCISCLDPNCIFGSRCDKIDSRNCIYFIPFFIERRFSNHFNNVVQPIARKTLGQSLYNHMQNLRKMKKSVCSTKYFTNNFLTMKINHFKDTCESDIRWNFMIFVFAFLLAFIIFVFSFLFIIKNVLY